MEHLTGVDERFARYSSTLFSQTSLEVNREQQTQKENDKLNKSISSYLRLLAGYLQLPAALKTLEYLIRRYLYVPTFSYNSSLPASSSPFFCI